MVGREPVGVGFNATRSRAYPAHLLPFFRRAIGLRYRGTRDKSITMAFCGEWHRGTTMSKIFADVRNPSSRGGKCLRAGWSRRETSQLEGANCNLLLCRGRRRFLGRRRPRVIRLGAEPFHLAGRVTATGENGPSGQKLTEAPEPLGHAGAVNDPTNRPAVLFSAAVATMRRNACSGLVD